MPPENSPARAVEGDNAEVAGKGTEAKAPAAVMPGRIRAFMLAKFPDRTYADDAEVENHAADWMEQTDKQLQGYLEADETIRRVAAEYPEIMAIAKDLATDPGLPLGVAIRRNIDEDELEVPEDDPGFEALRKRREERAERQKAKEAYQQQLDKNLEQSRETVQQYLTDNEMSEEEANALGKYVDGIMEDYLNGRVTAEVLNMFRNAMNYKKDVADAREVGKVEGLNSKIDAERQRRETATDGLPGPGSSTGALAPPAPAAAPDLIDEIVNRTESRRNWMNKK